MILTWAVPFKFWCLVFKTYFNWLNKVHIDIKVICILRLMYIYIAPAMTWRLRINVTCPWSSFGNETAYIVMSAVVLRSYWQNAQEIDTVFLCHPSLSIPSSLHSDGTIQTIPHGDYQVICVQTAAKNESESFICQVLTCRCQDVGSVWREKEEREDRGDRETLIGAQHSLHVRKLHPQCDLTRAARVLKSNVPVTAVLTNYPALLRRLETLFRKMWANSSVSRDNC